ncbi:CLUMA_CG015263, isoform A [Clunio marinus]|uniref:tRNA-uridine aminocarboxypropyltransferase 1 n=1 Tax=Clunio marinus TaxID=568069 RepID=A0A1J1IQT1_9DIPT|nr:CLUMA_CG015263, isoform A [Clunio marinus]
MNTIYNNLEINNYNNLLKVEGRFRCDKCKSSRKFFCYKCSCPHPEYADIVPRVELPIQIDIIKHRQEVFGKSTSSHAKIISPDQVNIYEYPEIPDYSAETGDVILIFPSSKSVSISSLFKGISTFDFKENYGLEKGFFIGTLLKKNLDEVMSDSDRERLHRNGEHDEKIYSRDNLPFKRAVFIDSTWKQCRSIYKDPRINSIKSCVIQNRKTKFWRTQKGAPDWYLSTIEAIHQFLLEVHVSAWGIHRNYYDKSLNDLELDTSFIPPTKIFDDNDNGEKSMCKPYNGQYDNLLFFFSFLHCIIHSLDDVNGKLKMIEK